jgi:predicted acylesterase/phospholipase RssA
VRLALVLGAGGLFAAWEAGVWKALHGRIDLSMVVGASAGAWNGWLIAAGASPDELADCVARSGGRARAASRGAARDPRQGLRDIRAIPAQSAVWLTVTSIPLLRQHLVQGNAITWQHLAATSSLPVLYPPVTIDGSWFIDGGIGGAVPLWAAEEMEQRGASQ